MKVDDVSEGAVDVLRVQRRDAPTTRSASSSPIDTFTITPSVVGGAGGTARSRPAPTQTVDYGATPTFTFTPDDGYHVKEVKVDGEAVDDDRHERVHLPGGHQGPHDQRRVRHRHVHRSPSTRRRARHHQPGTGPVDYGSSPSSRSPPTTGYHIADVVADGKSLGAVADGDVHGRRGGPHPRARRSPSTRSTITPSVVGTPAHGTIDAGDDADGGLARHADVHVRAGRGLPRWRRSGWTAAGHHDRGQRVHLPGGDRRPHHQRELRAMVCTITVTAGEHGSITPGTGEVAVGLEPPTYSITPDPGYRVTDVLVDGSPVGPVTELHVRLRRRQATPWPRRSSPRACRRRR